MLSHSASAVTETRDRKALRISYLAFENQRQMASAKCTDCGGYSRAEVSAKDHKADYTSRKRQRLEEEEDQSKADRACQTDPVLVFSCARDLHAFLRQHTLLMGRCDRGLQTEADTRAAAAQTCPDATAPPAPSFGEEDRRLLLSIHRRLAAASPDPGPDPADSPGPAPDLIAPVYERPAEVGSVKDEPDCHVVEAKLAPSPDAAWDDCPPSLAYAVRDPPTGYALVETPHDGDSSSNGPTPTPAMVQGRPRLRTHHLFCVPNHRVVEITTYNDVRPTAPDEEFRICPFICESLLKKSCSIGNFGWRLVSTIYRTEEMRERNYFGNRGKRPLSPRRLHAVEHAYYDYLANEDPTLCLAEARNAINQGLRNITHNLTDFSLSAAGAGGVSLKGAQGDRLEERRSGVMEVGPGLPAGAVLHSSALT